MLLASSVEWSKIAFIFLIIRCVVWLSIFKTSSIEIYLTVKNFTQKLLNSINSADYRFGKACGAVRERVI